MDLLTMKVRALAAFTLVIAVFGTLGVGIQTRIATRRDGSSAGEGLARRMQVAHEAAGIDVSTRPGSGSPGDTEAPTELGPAAAAFALRLGASLREVERAPDDPDAHLRLARLLHDGHRMAEAAQHYGRVLELDPDRAEAYYDLAAAHAADGDWESAEGVLLRRLEDVPDDATVLYDLGAVRANRGDFDGARIWWVRALDAPMDVPMRLRIETALARLGGSDPP